MNKLLLIIVVAGIMLLSGCAAKQPEYDPSIVPAKTVSTISADTLKAAAAIVAPASEIKPVAVTTPAVSQTAPVTNTAPGMNPPHGQPNHRCDIAVGAPLNSKPSATVKPVTAPVQADVTSAQQNVQTNTPATNAAGKKLNPPHGQPGHDCSIAVGQPLKN
jgi:outer membrane murein-binding lipoprotein Lpp